MAETPIRRTGLRQEWVLSRHSGLIDAALGLIVAALSIAIVLVGPGPQLDSRRPDSVDVAVALGAAVLITMRRRWPLAALTLASVPALLIGTLSSRQTGLLVATLIILWTVAYATSRRVAWIAGACVGIAIVVGTVRAPGDTWIDAETLLAWTVVTVALGDAARSRHSYVIEVERRARSAEQSRDEEARRRVVEERIHIARELHDVVAHHIALVNVQAGVAAHLLRSRPDTATEALAHVQDAARTVLSELAVILRVLRSEDHEQTLEPATGLDGIETLLDSMSAAGMRVHYGVEGQARELPPAIDFAAYRIVQESLTNAHKHGSRDSANLVLRYGDDGLDIEVDNPVSGDGADGMGYGLFGMRERAAMVGGVLETSRGAGSFVVNAFLPIPGDR